MTSYQRLLEPGQIGNIKTKNRIFKTGAGSTLGDGSGKVTQRHKTFYGALARGGVGLIVVESGSIDHTPEAGLSSGGGTFLRFDNDDFIPSFRELTDLIHEYNCPTFFQLMMGGATEPAPGVPGVSSSVLTPEEMKERQPYHKAYLLDNPQPPRELTIEEIGGLVEKFAQAAERAAKAGFDGVEVNGGNGHLINAFVSRVWNRRHDKYGCDNLENRARFVVEILQAIKKRVGQDFVVTVNFNAAEYGIENATTLEEGLVFARLFQEAGADAILGRAHGYKDVSMDIIWPERIFIPEPPDPLPKDCYWKEYGAGAFMPIAAAIKKVVTIPVLLSGRIYPEFGESILRQDKADFIGMTRRLQADPELPNKLASGRADEIAPCTACSHCLESNSFRIPIVCRINAALGGEEECIIKPAKIRKKVVVVGGGPAAMESARVAAIRGHDVTLYEKEKKLGGLLPMAAIVKGTEVEDLPAISSYLENQIINLGVNIHLGEEFTPDLIDEIKPDVVILAIGGISYVPEIPGIYRNNVLTNTALHRKLKMFLKLFSPNTLRWLSRFWMPLGKSVVIIGGAIQGCELAEFLVKRGRKVTVVDTSEELCDMMPVRNKIKLLKWLPKKGAFLISGIKEYVEINKYGLTIITGEGKRQTIEADTIVTALPLRPNQEMSKVLQSKVPEIYNIGDCRDPSLIINAIADGYRIAKLI
ncbi:MAG: FAD-dependent oxidoreductase [Dehalococcoidia bacterium]|jgi:2,4-dienoyl-CoA reductase (NADPH2)